jgi:hypothetical protein
MRIIAVVIALVALSSCGRESVGINGIVRVSEDGKVLTFATLSCNGDPKVKVTETDTEVQINIRAKSSGDDCADGATVTLARPLGDREVLDGKTDRPARVERPA